MSALDVTDVWQKSQLTYITYTYANPMVFSVLSATGRAYTMLRTNQHFSWPFDPPLPLYNGSQEKMLIIMDGP